MSEELKKVNLDIWLTEKESFINLYQKSYENNLHKDFIENKEDKKHNINSHTKWFNKKIKLNHLQDNLQVVNKWKICMVDYWMNVWTEINWIRPSIIFKNTNYKYWEDITVIPITSYKEDQEEQKSKDEFDVEIKASEENWLDNNSLIKIRQLRCVSKKRLKLNRKWDEIVIKGELEESYHDEIQTKLKIMLWI